jgi:hypothetical protein
VSWNNAQASTLVPILSATYRNPPDPQPCTTDCTAWDEEIIAIQTSNPGSQGTVWRFANHRSNILSDPDPNCIEPTYFRYQPIAVISQDGRWALFHSNWEKQLGVVATPEACGKKRTDVFVVELPAP